MAKRKIMLNGKEVTLIGDDQYGFDVVDDPTAGGKITNEQLSRKDLAKKIGLTDEYSPLSHRVTFDENGIAQPKVEKKVRVYTDKKGRIIKAEEIEGDQRDVRSLTEYKSDYTEEVFTGIAAPYINQGGAFFHTINPGEWDIGVFRTAEINSELSGISVPVPFSIYDAIDDAEGTRGGLSTTVKSSFFSGSSTSSINAPLRPVSLQQSNGTMALSITCDFKATQAGLTNLIAILQNGTGFKEGQNSSNRVEFQGIRWAGMLQHNEQSIVVKTTLYENSSSPRTITLFETRDPAVIDNGDTNAYFRMFLIYVNTSTNDVGKWKVSIVRTGRGW